MNSSVLTCVTKLSTLATKQLENMKITALYTALQFRLFLHFHQFYVDL